MRDSTHPATSKVGREGLEPSKAEPADLQSAPFAARDTDPRIATESQLAEHPALSEKYPRAGDGTRTHDKLITSQLLCRLSYAGDAHYTITNTRVKVFGGRTPGGLETLWGPHSQLSSTTV
jgi:hypothetical protein